MTEKLHSIAEVMAHARKKTMNPRGARRHLTCETCGQMYDKDELAQVSHHLSATHAKWAPQTDSS